MRPSTRITAKQAAEDIITLVKMGCNVRIQVKFETGKESYLYPVDYKITKSEPVRALGAKDTMKSSKVEPWFICNDKIVVSFNSCFPYIEIQDVHGQWQKNFISIHHDVGTTPTFDVAIRWNENMNMLMRYKTADQVQPGDMYIYFDHLRDEQGLAIVTQIEDIFDTDQFIIKTTRGSNSYNSNTKDLNKEDYFVLIDHTDTRL